MPKKKIILYTVEIYNFQGNGMKSKILLDSVNRFIISEMIKNGRVKLTTMADKLNITPAAVKERVDRLIEKKIIKVSALINAEKLFPLSASVGIEADNEGINILIKKLRMCPLITSITKTSGTYNLIVNMVSSNLTQLDNFLNSQIRSEPGIKHVEVNIGNATIIPEYRQIRLLIDPENKMDESQKCPLCKYSHLDVNIKKEQWS